MRRAGVLIHLGKKMRGKHEEKKRREEEERRMQGWAVYGAMEELKKK